MSAALWAQVGNNAQHNGQYSGLGPDALAPVWSTFSRNEVKPCVLPVVGDDGAVFTSLDCQSIQCFEPDTGTVRWTVPFQSGAAISNIVALTAFNTLVLWNGTQLAHLNASNGHVLSVLPLYMSEWRPSGLSGLTVDGDTAFAAVGGYSMWNSILYAVRLSPNTSNSMVPLWNVSLSGSGDPLPIAVSQDRQTVFYATCYDTGNGYVDCPLGALWTSNGSALWQVYMTNVDSVDTLVVGPGRQLMMGGFGWSATNGSFLWSLACGTAAVALSGQHNVLIGHCGDYRAGTTNLSAYSFGGGDAAPALLWTTAVATLDEGTSSCPIAIMADAGGRVILSRGCQTAPFVSIVNASQGHVLWESSDYGGYLVPRPGAGAYMLGYSNEQHAFPLYLVALENGIPTPPAPVFVLATGQDTGTCSQQLPCKTLEYAVGVVAMDAFPLTAVVRVFLGPGAFIMQSCGLALTRPMILTGAGAVDTTVSCVNGSAGSPVLSTTATLSLANLTLRGDMPASTCLSVAQSVLDINISISGVVFQSCLASAISVEASARLTVDRCAFRRNIGDLGGAIFMTSSYSRECMAVTNSVFDSNSAGCTWVHG